MAEDKLLLPREVAELFRVNPKTVARWAKTGRLPYIETIGGQKRYRESVVMRLLNGSEKDEGGE